VLDKEMEVVVVVAAAVAVEENIMLQVACKLPSLETFLMFYMELKDCTVETKVPSLKIPPPH
jgi:hypothetical protein